MTPTNPMQWTRVMRESDPTSESHLEARAGKSKITVYRNPAPCYPYGTTAAFQKIPFEQLAGLVQVDLFAEEPAYQRLNVPVLKGDAEWDLTTLTPETVAGLLIAAFANTDSEIRAELEAFRATILYR